MACTLSNAVSSIISTGRASTTANLPSAKEPSCSLRTVSSLVRPAKALALANSNGAQQGGELPKSLQQSRRPPRDSSLLLLDTWDPFSRGGLRQMMNSVDRLFFDDMALARANGARGGSTKAASSMGIRSPWDVVEDEEGFYIRVDMPGFGKEDVKLAVEDGVLAVSGQRDPSKEDPRWAAKSYSKFNTRLALPDNVRFDKISAELKNGVLFVAVPKLKSEDLKQVFDIHVT